MQNKKENQLLLAADSTAVEARGSSIGKRLKPVHAAYANLIKNVWDPLRECALLDWFGTDALQQLGYRWSVGKPTEDAKASIDRLLSIGR